MKTSRLLELAGLSAQAEATKLLEAASTFKVYAQDPYGSGYVKKALKKGVMLTTEKGDVVEFIRITDDGKKIVINGAHGKEIEVTPKSLGAKILPATEKPSGPGWA